MQGTLNIVSTNGTVACRVLSGMAIENVDHDDAVDVVDAELHLRDVLQ